jgi:hypothetical protein
MVENIVQNTITHNNCIQICYHSIKCTYCHTLFERKFQFNVKIIVLFSHFFTHVRIYDIDKVI